MISVWVVTRRGGADGLMRESVTYFTNERDAKTYANDFPKSDYLQSRAVGGPIKVAESLQEAEAATMKD